MRQAGIARVGPDVVCIPLTVNCGQKIHLKPSVRIEYHRESQIAVCDGGHEI